ncbi:MAG: Stp1/IreP family PP2C-type Ser/Thr phosphatase [Candidatus Riflebacteria bacterium]|nr:Stp1/IreP family PP2C-type Ser/Thr phosphatase [Candidatus Riflebacteria bacterium]
MLARKPKIERLDNGQIIGNIEIGWLTNRGRKRDHNEDDLYVFSALDTDFETRGMLFAVADGMGGHAGGEYASRIAVESLEKFYQLDLGQGENAPNPQDMLRRCIEEAHSHIYSQAQSQPVLRGMGTTLTAALLNNGTLNVGQIGDSRAYLIRNCSIKQLTNDHSLVAEQIRMGIITPEEAACHPARNIITRALGTKEKVEPDFYTFALESDDRVLMCSDGLHGVVEDDRLLEITLQAADAPSACIRLVEEANANGGPDNITVVIIHLKPILPFWRRLLRL